MPYLSKRALQGLKAYKYKPAGYTKLDEIHTPFWNCELRWRRGAAKLRGSSMGFDTARWSRRRTHPTQTYNESHTPGTKLKGIVERLPLWLAPNLITLTGTMGLVVAYCVAMYYTPDFEGEVGLRGVGRVVRVCAVRACVRVWLRIGAGGGGAFKRPRAACALDDDGKNTPTE